MIVAKILKECYQIPQELTKMIDNDIFLNECNIFVTIKRSSNDKKEQECCNLWLISSGDFGVL